MNPKIPQIDICVMSIHMYDTHGVIIHSGPCVPTNFKLVYLPLVLVPTRDLMTPRIPWMDIFVMLIPV